MLAETRKRRIVRDVLRVAIVASAIVLPVAFYVLGYCVHNWNRAVSMKDVMDGTDDREDYRRHDWLFSPLYEYAGADFPGSDTLLALNWWSQAGGESTWEDCKMAVREDKARKKAAPSNLGLN